MNKLLLAGFLLLTFLCLHAGNLTPGNIVVVRVGDGTAALTNSSTAVFLDEYTTSGTLVQSLPAPTTVSGSNHALTVSGIATSEGSLNLSANGMYLTLTGYDTVVGVATIATGTTNRTLARVGSNGVFNTSTGFLAGSAYVTNNIRGAVTNDGTQFWTAGSGSSSTGGVWYLPFGSFTAGGIQTSTTSTNTRTVNIFNGQLYFSTASVATGIYTDGTGLPTTASQTEAILPGLPSTDPLQSPYAFLLLDENSSVAGVDVLYVADDNTTSPAGGIYKYSLVAGSWVPNGNIPSTNGLRGITGFNVCSGTQLYVTGNNGVYTFFDSSGYNQTISGSLNQIVTAATNTVVRGIAFAPGTVTPTAPVASIGSKSNISCFGANNGAINISIAGGAAPLHFVWTGGSTSQNRTNLGVGSYSVTVTDFYGCSSSVSTSISQPAALAITIDSVTNLPCTGGNTGAVTIGVAGGTSPYHYNWAPGNITTQNISGLTAGSYKVTVTDSAGCTIKDSAIVSQSGSLTVADSVTEVSCYGLSDGSISVTVSGGTPNYTYQWGGSSNTTASISNLAQGAYTVTISDQAGCILTVPITVTQPDSISLAFVSVNDSAFGGASGYIDLTVSGGSGPGYTYQWSNSATTGNINALVANTYCVTVTDQHSCKDSNCVIIGQPTGLNDLAWVSSFSAYSADGNMIISFSAAETMNIRAEIYDLAGHVIYQSTSVYGPYLDLHISEAEISSGCYVIKIVSDQGYICRKIAVLK